MCTTAALNRWISRAKKVREKLNIKKSLKAKNIMQIFSPPFSEMMKIIFRNYFSSFEGEHF